MCVDPWRPLILCDQKPAIMQVVQQEVKVAVKVGIAFAVEE